MSIRKRAWTSHTPEPWTEIMSHDMWFDLRKCPFFAAFDGPKVNMSWLSDQRNTSRPRGLQKLNVFQQLNHGESIPMLFLQAVLNLLPWIVWKWMLADFSGCNNIGMSKVKYVYQCFFFYIFQPFPIILAARIMEPFFRPRDCFFFNREFPRTSTYIK